MRAPVAQEPAPAPAGNDPVLIPKQSVLPMVAALGATLALMAAAGWLLA
jgi:hypothetical protein